MTLYYCKTPQDWISIINPGELYQGTTLDNQIDAAFANLEEFTVKAEAAQAELEIYISRFDVRLARVSNSKYLSYAHAVIIWYYLEVNGEIRDLVQTKYDAVIKVLGNMSAIVRDDGTTIVPPTTPVLPPVVVTPSSRSGTLVGDRTLEPVVYPSYYPQSQPETGSPISIPRRPYPHV